MQQFLRNTLLAAIVTMAPVCAAAEEVMVFAAASLKTALDQIATDWQAETGNTVVVSYGSSAALAKQIQQGAPADVFLSAAVNWMDLLQGEALIVDASRRDLLGNTLVLVGQANAAAPVQITSAFDLAGLLGDGKLAMGLVSSVPAGQYGKEALVSLGLWNAVEANVAQAENVRAALALVATGEAPLGIVYGSDAIAEPAVQVLGTFPTDSHSPIVYPGAVLAASGKLEAGAFLDALSSDAARAIFVAQGFTVLK